MYLGFVCFGQCRIHLWDAVLIKASCASTCANKICLIFIVTQAVPSSLGPHINLRAPLKAISALSVKDISQSVLRCFRRHASDKTEVDFTNCDHKRLHIRCQRDTLPFTARGSGIRSSSWETTTCSYANVRLSYTHSATLWACNHKGCVISMDRAIAVGIFTPSNSICYSIFPIDHLHLCTTFALALFHSSRH